MNRKAMYNILFAASKSTYYKKTLKDDIETYLDDFTLLPIITKKNVRENCMDMFTANIDESDILIESTSGTTGVMLNIYWRKYELMNANLSLWRCRMKNGISPNSKMCTFHTYIKKKYEFYALDDLFIPEVMYMNNDNIISLSKKEMIDSAINYHNLICEFKPDWIYTQPSTFVLLIRKLELHGLVLPESIKYVELTGEYITDEMYNYIKEKYPRIIFANHYGAKEVGCIAYECLFGNLHCLIDNTYVEIINKRHDESGYICVTSLNNKYFPLIRYQLEDEGKIIHNHSCKCGSKSPILVLNYCRSTMKLITKDKQEYDSFIFLYAVNVINNYCMIKIIQYQIIQLDLENAKVNFIINKRDEKDEIEIIKKFKDIMDEMNIHSICWTFEMNGEVFTDNNKTLSFLSYII